MSDHSAIEWTDATWNPIRARRKNAMVGDPGWRTQLPGGPSGWHCEHVSPGCEHCYAEGINKRLGTGLPFKPGHRGDIEIFLDEKMLLAPLKWKKPRRIFVGSMTDLFADFVTDEMLLRIFGVMAHARQHAFQLLTKRAARMREFCDQWARQADSIDPITGGYELCDWPLPNVWLGVSAERQHEANERLPLLMQTPAAVRFISAEPLLGPIDLNAINVSGEIPLLRSAVSGNGRRLDWVIVGGESGPSARPMSVQWARELRDQCAAAEVAFFFKQWGEWAPAYPQPSGAPGRFSFGDYEHDRSRMIQCDGYPRQFTKLGARSTLQRVGKKAAGRLLDGREHNDQPTQRKITCDDSQRMGAEFVP